MTPSSGMSSSVVKDDLSKDISNVGGDIPLSEQDTTTLTDNKSSSAVPITESNSQPDRDTLVVTPKLDEGEYKSDYRDDPPPQSDLTTAAAAAPNKCDQSEPSSSNIKPEEPSSTTRLQFVQNS